MIQYYAGRELSEKLEINLAKWKRWSREFLPPDPLGGFQSGYARQYTVDDVFWVFLGGHLVNNMNLSIPESKMVLKDLRPWLNDHGFMSRAGSTNPNDVKTEPFIEEYVIEVTRNVQKRIFCYHIRGIVSRETVEIDGTGLIQERYTEQYFLEQDQDFAADSRLNVKNLFITRVLKKFVRKMEIGDRMFRSLSYGMERVSPISAAISETGIGVNPIPFSSIKTP